jgi:hypothetical protein
MNSFLEDLLALLESIVSAAGERGLRQETIAELYVHGSIDSDSAPRLSRALRDLHGRRLSSVSIIRRGESVSLDDVATITGELDIRLMKHNTAQTFYFYDAAFLSAFFADDSAVSRARTVLIARGVESFQTLQCSYARWEDTLVPDEVQMESAPTIEVRRLVVDLSGHDRVPSSAGNLIISRNSHPVASEAYRQWKAYVARSLPTILVNEVRSSDDGDVLAVSSPRRVAIAHPEVAPDDALLALELDAARFVYAGGPGTENRLTFLTAELSRSWPYRKSWDTGFLEVGELALESARSAERLFASGKTGDVLKALGDLRKTLNEDVAKVMQQTRDLGSALWRDVAIAVTALAAKVATGGTPGLDVGVRSLLVLVSAFLVYSLAVTLVGNHRFLTDARKARAKWTRQTYSFLSETELRELALEPLEKTEAVYWWTSKMVMAAYAVIVIALLAVATWPWDASVPSRFRFVVTPTATPTPTPTPTPSPHAATGSAQRAQAPRAVAKPSALPTK